MIFPFDSRGNEDKLLLNQDKKYNYFLVKSTREQVIETEQLYKESIFDNPQYPNVKDLYMCGHIKEVLSHDCKKFIPFFKTHTLKDSQNAKAKCIDEYRCFQRNEPVNPHNNMIIHEDCLSAFKCACERLQTEHFIVIRVERLDESEAIKELEAAKLKLLNDVSNNNSDTSVHTESKTE